MGSRPALSLKRLRKMAEGGFGVSIVNPLKGSGNNKSARRSIIDSSIDGLTYKVPAGGGFPLYFLNSARSISSYMIASIVNETYVLRWIRLGCLCGHPEQSLLTILM